MVTVYLTRQAFSTHHNRAVRLWHLERGCHKSIVPSIAGCLKFDSQRKEFTRGQRGLILHNPQ